MKRIYCLIVVVLAILVTVQYSHAAPIIYTANLDGASEDPPVVTGGTGFAKVTYDDDANTLRVQVEFSGLTGLTTASHIHAATALPGIGLAGVATQVPSFTGFPLGVMSGTYDNIFDMTLASSWNPTFIVNNGGTTASAEAALAAALATDKAYFNIHTSFSPGGEIRGFLHVPEPATMLLLGLGLVGLAGMRRMRR